jgi:hypothetical protein
VHSVNNNINYYEGEWLKYLHGNENDTLPKFAFEYNLKGHEDRGTANNRRI